ncbi:helix-turn-helix domain-containing protein [Hyalangium rubrum]|uniref:Helix-turn-helix domain-containing protein n=1 Tax=Hyalangium rubrum TaxID=3103134 RepID=A0ABU5HH99_9BACT|nr:helix-turn-helix domain-containing protein [Hyalangium sp. s54d21]MDY7232834.1 helix-turn-helix domain-containing protein [Hyalangium sp. s54d21]
MTKEEIKKVRDGLGLTQEQFAQLLGVHTLTVSKWERGLLSPSPYQGSLISSFAKARERSASTGGATVAKVLMGAGVAAALFFLLKHAFDEEEAQPSAKGRGHQR